MSRAKIEALALVNWRGVFYERYQLDRAVTALEGANGAGKTTVMIAAYVALFPEIAKLRFTNLGEHEATKGDRGIYGRLGREGWPSFAVLDIRFGKGERVLAGVKLERKNEPVVELEPFVVRDLAEDVRLQDVLLDIQQEGERTVDRLVDKTRLTQRVARAGGTLKWLEPRQYFRELFDLGLTPLRLDTDDERSRFNHMLRTSMVGGISATLSGGLRDFVLREDTNLAESLKAMRANLLACQVTRREVEESGAAQREIAEVYRSAETMFTRAVHASRVRAAEQSFALDEARRAGSIAGEKLVAAQADVATTKLAAEAAGRSVDEHEGALQRAREWRVGIEAAGKLGRERVAAEQASAQTRAAWEREAESEGEAAGVQEQARKTWEDAVSERDRLSASIASSRGTWAEISRRAGLHEVAIQRQKDLITRLGADFGDVADYAAEGSKRASRMTELDRELTAARRDIGGAEQARRDFNAVLSALRAVEKELAAAGEFAGGPPAAGEVWTRAQAADARVRELRSLVEQRLSLGDRLRRATKAAADQQRLRQSLTAANLEFGTAQALLDAAGEARRDLRALLSAREGVQALVATADAALLKLRQRIGSLDEELPRWRAVQAQARELSDRVGTLPDSAAGLEAVEDRIRAEEGRIRKSAEAADHAADELNRRAGLLASSAGGVHDDLIEACELVEGELVVRRFDEVAIEDAAAMEALLGPLRNGVLVKDPAVAAARLLGHEHLPDEVWLITAVPDAPPGDRHPGAVAVHERSSVRVTKHPAQPVLGAAARQERIADLQREVASQKAASLASTREANTQAETALRARALRAEAKRWLAPDPANELEELRREASASAKVCDALGVQLAQATAAHSAADVRESTVRGFVPDAHLLDAADAAAERDALRPIVDRVAKVGPALARCHAEVEALSSGLSLLRTVPPSLDDVVVLQTRAAELNREWDSLDQDVRDLIWLIDNADALTWTDAPAAALSAAAGERSLRDAHESAGQAATDAKAAWDAADGEWTTAKDRLGEARVASETAAAELNRLLGEISALGVGEPTPEDESEARGRETGAQGALREARSLLKVAEKAATTSEIAAESALTKEQEAEAAVVRAEVQAKPAVDAWAALSNELETRNLTAGVFAEGVMAAVDNTASIQLSQEAREAQSALVAHVGKARRAEQISAVLTGGRTDDLRWEHYIRLWLAVRAWVRERVPPNVSESSDPVTALADLGRHLVGLGTTLERQEEQLKGSSASVANHIGQSLRRASTLISHLSRDLEAVRFGSIRRVDVQVKRRPEMNKLLDALRGEQAQAALFKDGTTLENALAEIYRRETGGRIAGEQLLDYRQYLELTVRVQRDGSAEWEAANATRMSTGEAIGVGAALMMVVLTAWERRELLGRAARKHGSIRFLFLDEANRLSQDNLKTLFELCDNLELQLLVAAPEVAQSEGNITYRLVRRVIGGQPVVDVSGRRTEA